MLKLLAIKRANVLYRGNAEIHENIVRRTLNSKTGRTLLVRLQYKGTPLLLTMRLKSENA